MTQGGTVLDSSEAVLVPAAREQLMFLFESADVVQCTVFARAKLRIHRPHSVNQVLFAEGEDLHLWRRVSSLAACSSNQEEILHHHCTVTRMVNCFGWKIISPTVISRVTGRSSLVESSGRLISASAMPSYSDDGHFWRFPFLPRPNSLHYVS